MIMPLSSDYNRSKAKWPLFLLATKVSHSSRTVIRPARDRL